MRLLAVAFMVIILVYGCTEKEKPIGEKDSERPSTPATVIPIADILNDPESYKGKDVTVKGIAEPGLAFEFVNEQPYKIKDDTGEIWVITTSIMPERESTVTVTGTVSAPYQIKGRKYDVVILEKEQR